MTAVAPETAKRFAAVAGRSGLVDVDVHAQLGDIEALSPYLEPQWLEFGREHQWQGPQGASQFYPPAAGSSADPAWRPGTGAVPASKLELVRQDVLEQLGVELAILGCYSGIDILRHPGWSAAVVRAINDWLAHEWLEPEPRLRGSIVLPARDPSAAAAEIERVANLHSGFVQALLPARSDRLYGERAWHPVYEALERHGLVLAIHRGGHSDASSPTGWASWFTEESVAEQQVYAAQLTSLVSNGVFQRCPKLRVTLLDCGFTWLPAFWWRMDADWRGLRREVPWLTEPPSTIIREHFRFAALPGDLGTADELRMLLPWLESDQLLMFATDYPHFGGDSVGTLLEALEPDALGAVLGANARAWYDF